MTMCQNAKDLGLDNPNSGTKRLLEVLEAGVGLEGLPERDAGLFAESIPAQAAEESQSQCKLGRK